MRARIQFARLTWLFCLFLLEVSSHNTNGGNEAVQAHLDNLSQAQDEQEASLVPGGNKDRGTGETNCEKLQIEFRSAGPLGIQFDGQLSIMAFTKLPGSRKGPAEKSGLLKIGDTLIAVNGDTIEGLSASDAFQVLEEAAAESAANGRHRVLEFCQKSAPGAPGEQRALSDYAAAAQGGSLEHLDVTDYNGEEQPIQAMLADGLGVVPENCPQANLVFVAPSYGCEEGLDTSSEILKGSIAVVWRGGSCSFYRKASVLQSYHVVGVVVVNSEDDLFRMQMDNLMDNDIRVPVAMISFIDGSRLMQLQQRFSNDMSRYLKARLVVSKSCLMQEQIELERQKETRELSKEEIQSGTIKSKQSELTKRHQLYGSLAPAGTISLHGDQGVPIAAFDFVSASWSGPLPIGSLLRMSQNKYLKVPVQEPVGLVLSEWEETGLDAALAQFALQPSYFCLILVSQNSSVYQLEGELPSTVKFAVVMVTNRAGRALAQASSSSRIQLVPNHSVLHQWHQARPLENLDTWPSDPKLRSRLLARFQTDQTRHGSTDVHGPIPPSSCLSRHLADIASRLE